MMVSTLAALLCACSPSKDSRHSRDETLQLSPRVIRVGDPVPRGGGVFKIGTPYLAGGKWYTPRHDENYDAVGLASWYGDFFHGRQTANGEVYDMEALSAAHPTLPMPTYAKVTNLKNNRSIIVRVNDRGPYKEGRIIDLSRRAAQMLGFHNQGLAPVRVQYHGPAPLDGDNRLEEAVAARQPWAANIERQPEPRAAPRTQAASLMLDTATTAAGFTQETGSGSAQTWSTSFQPRAETSQASLFDFFGSTRH